MWEAGRALARALCGNLLRRSHVLRKQSRVIGALVLASAILLLSFGAAQAQSTETLASTIPNGSNTFGQPTTFKATVTGFPNTGVLVPGGTVTFVVISLSGGSAISTVPVSNGQATFTVALLPVGFVGVAAFYNGDDPNFPGQSSGSAGINIVPAGTATTLTSSPNPSALNQPVTFTATVSGSAGGVTPTGTVTFFDLTTSQTLGTAAVGGSQQAVFTTSSLAAGNHNIQASYGGDGNFNGSTSALLTQTVNKSNTTATLSSSPNPSVAGQAVTFTATVSGNGGTPTGTVTFFSDGNSIGMGTLGSNGQAALTIATLSVGSHSITVSYAGDGNFNGSNGGPLTQTVNKNSTTTSVLSSANPSTFGQSVTFTAVLSPVTGTGGALVPSGTVTFFADGNSIGTGTLGSNGQASVSISTLAVGSHTITTTYGGDNNFTGSNGTLTPNQQVISTIGTTATTTTLLSSQNPSSVGQSVTFTATVSGSGGTPTGTVTFSVDGGAGRRLRSVAVRRLLRPRH